MYNINMYKYNCITQIFIFINRLLQIYRVDTRTNQEKAEDLIQEYLAPMELPSTSDLCKDIEEMLNSLQDDGNRTVSGHYKVQNVKL